MDAQLSTKGQLQMTEVVLVVFALIVILVLGIFFFYRQNIISLQTTSTVLSEQQASVLVSRIARLPELSCRENACLDTAKFFPFEKLAKNPEYRKMLGKKRIIVEQVYPDPYINKTCLITDYNQVAYPDNCNQWIIYSHPEAQGEKFAVSAPVALYYPEFGIYRLGMLTVEVYK